MKPKAFVARFIALSMLFTQTAWAFNDIVVPQNVIDNPINHIVVDPDRAGNAHLDRAQNGTPVININAASVGGVSANYFRDFNVNDENLILNNLQGEAGVSKLGGALHGNPNLNVAGARAADIILNEVTSNRVSNINGYTEIFGKQAELIIANPNGIMVGGAGFINTSRLSMVTGSSDGLDANGNLNPFMLSEKPNALISVTGRDIYDASGNPVAYNLGIDMSSGNYVDLLSRAVEINGKLLASKEINIKTGNDTATRGADGNWTVASTDKAGKPEFAIDSTALGGIYAGRVNIIASVDGVGVRTRGDVIANMDDIKYDARGNIEIAGENSAARDIEISATKITNTNEITAKNNVAITADELENTGGQIVAVKDLDLDFGANNWTSSGVIHAGGTLSLAANNFTNVVDDFSGNNIVIDAIGNVTNDGIIKADNNLTITSGDSVYNSDGMVIHAGRDLSISAATRILNKGFIQALGKLAMTTAAAINGDYVLNENAQNLPTDTDIELAPEYQAIYDDLGNTDDIVILSDLLNNIKTAEQYYAVQARLRLVKITALLADYAISDDGINIAEIIASPEAELQETLSNFLGENYDASEWAIDISAQIALITANVDAQQARADQYNLDNETSLTRAEYAAAVAEEFVNYDALVDAAQLAAETDRADKIIAAIAAPAELAREYQLLDWASLDDSDIDANLGELLGEEYDPAEWATMPYVDSSMDLTNAYLNSLRINSIDRANVEQTGIHNDGRIYSGGNMSLISNSVLHNNKGALIYSGGNADFAIKNVLFNNENAAGQGIFANGTLNIAGANAAWLPQLINYDGAIESNGDMEILATEVINYGSDSADFSQIDNAIYEAHEYRYYYRQCTYGGAYPHCLNLGSSPGAGPSKEKSRVITKAEYDTRKAKGDKVTDKFLYYYVKDYPALSESYTNAKEHLADPQNGKTIKTDTDTSTMTAESDASVIRSNAGALSILADNITNYNSRIAGLDINITATNLLNTTLMLNVNGLDYYTRRSHDCVSHILGFCDQRAWRNHNFTKNKVNKVYGTSPATIVALNNLNIAANKIGNGTFVTDDIGASGYLPYAPLTVPETPLQEIVRTGTIDPLANFKLPDGQYGVIRLGNILNGHYLYESDPMLVDIEHYLGSQYFMNRIGIDPSDVESKFMGDAFVEHEIIKKSLEQISGFRNTQMTGAELDEYINNLYNALDASMVADLGLEFGKQLTARQIAQLDMDIVWYVRTEIVLSNGEKIEVLVPQVYLAQSTLDELYGAALARDDVKTSIRGDNVTIEHLTAEADAILSNIGAIIGNRELVISTDELNNAALTIGGQNPVLRGGEILTINTGTLDNTGMIAGGDVTITADEINNITLTQMDTATGKGFKQIETHVNDAAMISSTGDMNIATTGDLNMSGSKIASDGDINLNIGGDLNSMAIADYEYEYNKQKWNSGFLGLTKNTETIINESLTNQVSEISAGNNLNIDIDGDLLSVGTEFSAGEDLNISAENMNFLNVTDIESYYHKRTKETFDLLGTIVETVAAVVVVVSTAGTGTAAVAAAVGAGATGTVDGAIHEKGSVKTQTNYDETVVGTTLSGKNINLESKNDIVMLSTEIDSANPISLEYDGELVVEDIEERHDHDITDDKFGRTFFESVVNGAVIGAVFSGVSQLFAPNDPIDQPQPPAPQAEQEDSERAREEQVEKLGEMSRFEESRGDSAVVGHDDTGGYSYGRYQISTSSSSDPNGYGTMETFMDALKEYDPSSYEALITAGGLDAAKAGTQEFRDAWASVTNSPNFVDAERAFIYETHYLPVVNNVAKYDPYIMNRPTEIQQAIWGQSVQLGEPLNKVFFQQFSKTISMSNLTDIELAKSLYEYKLSTIDRYFKSSSLEIRDSIRDRYRNELNKILNDLGGKK